MCDPSIAHTIIPGTWYLVLLLGVCLMQGIHYYCGTWYVYNINSPFIEKTIIFIQILLYLVGSAAAIPVSVFVLHIKPFFLPVDIQHNQCPCRFFNTREIQVLWSHNYAPERQQQYYCKLLRTRYAVSTLLIVDNALPCHHIGYDGTTYTLC